jgi:PhoPQ-activated pathogenicity-related protein
MERGAEPSHAEWLARLPMTRAAVRAMDAATDYVKKNLNRPLNRFVVAGASKRGWTTWTTAIADDRVVAIAPIVIDLLNLVPSFEHHWRAYGAWSPAINNYVHEGVMDWMNSVEFARLLEITDPYTYRNHLTLPKMIINASGDEFFLPDSWKFYWQNLVGEKHVRYVPNTGHSLKDTDALETLIAFHHSIVTNRPRPDFDWQVENGAVAIQTNPQFPPTEIKLWQAVNDSLRSFRVDILGKKWTSENIPLAANGHYQVQVEKPARGWKAFFVELTFPGPGKYPFKQTTGVVVVPETLPFPEFKPARAMGRSAGQ